jgi:hypothetical protein
MINEKFESFFKNKSQPEFTHKNLTENLKIVVENPNFGEQQELQELQEQESPLKDTKETTELLDYDDLVEMEEQNEKEANAAKMKEPQTEDGEIDIDADEDDDETEFHVNLDKVPPTLQNTILNEKVYLNESLKDETSTSEHLDVVEPADLTLLYESLNLDETCFISQHESAAPTSIQISNNLFRKDALHLHGVDELSTNDIFAYFDTYKPTAVEWIDDSSCNVIWKSENHAVNALKNMSIPYNEDGGNDQVTKDKDQTLKSLRKPPQGTKWRIGAKSAKGYHIFMRFVRLKSDRKRKGAESRSKYYVKYGNPNYGNLKGLISTSRRKLLKEQQMNNAVADLSDLFDENPKSPKHMTVTTANATIGDTEPGSRQLVSYNIDDYGSTQMDNQEMEEFGTNGGAGVTGSLFSKVIKAKAEKNNLILTPKRHQQIELTTNSRSSLKRKKMAMYSDDLNDEDEDSGDVSGDDEGLTNIKKNRTNEIFTRLGSETQPPLPAALPPRRNGNVPLKDRLSGFSSAKNGDHHRQHRHYERNRYHDDTSRRGDTNRSLERYEDKKPSLLKSIVFDKNHSDRQRQVDRRRQEKDDDSDDSDNSTSNDSNDSRQRLKSRLTSFVSTSTIAKKKLV